MWESCVCVGRRRLYTGKFGIIGDNMCVFVCLCVSLC